MCPGLEVWCPCEGRERESTLPGLGRGSGLVGPGIQGLGFMVLSWQHEVREGATGPWVGLGRLELRHLSFLPWQRFWGTCGHGNTDVLDFWGPWVLADHAQQAW